MITDEELSRRLGREAASRQTGKVPNGVIALLVSDARSEVESGSLRRKILAGAVGVAVVGGGLVAAPAAAEVIRHFLAQTDIVFSGTEVVEDSEFVDTSASDLGAYIESIYPAWLPLAPGQTREGVIEQVSGARAAEPGIGQEVGLRRDLEHAVYVGWIDEWIAAQAAGDADRMAVAAGFIADAATWPAFTATDGGGVTYIMAGYAREIAAGKADAAQELAQVEGAPSWDGVDRSDQPGSYFGNYLNEYQAGQ